SLSGAPAWLSINGSNQLVGTPPQSAGNSVVTFTITASNGVNPNAVQSFTLTVWTADQRYVEALYQADLGRPGDLSNPHDAGFWVALLGNGTLSRMQVAAGVVQSLEGDDFLVRGWYVSYLGRAAQGGEELGWVNELQAGQTEEQVLSQ